VVYGRSLNAGGAQAYYIPLSLVGITSFRDGLLAANQSTDRIFVTQSIKQDPGSILLAASTAALQTIGAPSSGFSTEGYLAGRFIVEVLSKTPRPYTPEKFLQTIYANQIFLIDQQRLGLFADVASGSTSVCNQGAKEVFLMSIDPVTGNFTYLADSQFAWTASCQSSTSELVRPIVFGQAAPLTGANSNLGINMRDGINIAFDHVNRLGGIEGRPLKLITHDDGYVESRTVEITQDLITDGAIGLIGFVGTQNTLAAVNISRPARIPIIGPYTGAQSLRTPCSKTLLHTRASYNDEAGAIVTFLLDQRYSALRNGRQFSRIAIFYQDDLFGQTVRDAVSREMGYRNKTLLSEASYSRNTLDIELVWLSWQDCLPHLMRSSQSAHTVPVQNLFDVSKELHPWTLPTCLSHQFQQMT
jgi:ABC-type branched-subunit amino acid transport system substrate-binding protein